MTQEQRARTIIRLDAGSGTVEEVNACLEAGYQFHGKDFSTARARHLAKSVQTWYDDAAQSGRQVGLVTSEPADDVRPVVRIALRWTTKQGQEQVCVLISTLLFLQILRLTGAQCTEVSDQASVLAAYATSMTRVAGVSKPVSSKTSRGWDGVISSALPPKPCCCGWNVWRTTCRSGRAPGFRLLRPP